MIMGFFIITASLSLIGKTPEHPEEPYTTFEALKAIVMFVAVFILGFKEGRDEEV